MCVESVLSVVEDKDLSGKTDVEKENNDIPEIKSKLGQTTNHQQNAPSDRYRQDKHDSYNWTCANRYCM